MKKSTMVALGCGAGAVACIALAVHFWRRRQTGEAVACGVVGGCAVCTIRKREAHQAGRNGTPRQRDILSYIEEVFYGTE